jgi:phosphatidylserine/phosphatidylglycerophosphate/cardiolipin synthase-like enzyme
MKLIHLLIILAIVLVIGIIIIDNSNDETKNKISSKVTGKSKILYENGSIEVYFCPAEDCNTIILEELNNSKDFKCAFFDLTDRRISDLFRFRNESMIIHHENYKGYGFARQTNGLMHDKFCILDDKKIITGSHNPTISKNKDNVLVIESKFLAENYNNEFQNLIAFSPAEKRETKHTELIFNNYKLENYFCPQDDCQDEILEEIRRANSSVYFFTYTFTDKEIANLLVSKKSSGLDVRGVIESYQGKTYWVVPILEAGSVPVVLDSEQSLQHNKVFIIDNRTVITGSYNPTISANTINDENIIILRQPDIVKEYIDNFEHLYAELQE